MTSRAAPRLRKAKRRRVRSKTTLSSLRRLILIFQVLALILILSINTQVPYDQRLIFTICLTAGTYFTGLISNKITKGDKYIILIALFMFSIGSLMIYRLEPSLAIKQSIWLIVGVIAYFVVYFTLKLVRGWEKWGVLYFIVILALFIFTLSYGTIQGGAKNWIILGPISIQPSEFIKILLVFFVASYYSKEMKRPQVIIKDYDLSNYLLMGCVYFFIALLFLQAELGTALIFYGLLFLMQYVYEEDRKQMLINLALAVFGAVLAYILFDHIKIRVHTWLDPWSDINNTGYQITQSLFAIASGGFFGRGLGMGQPDLIPLSFTDFIFSAICEEMGIFAGIGVMMLFLLLVYRGFKIAFSQEDKFFSIVALGISIVFALQAFIIFAGVMKVIPLTGITIPFMTYGGSSVLASFMSIGVLQYTSETIGAKDENTK